MKDVWIFTEDSKTRRMLIKLAEDCGGRWYGQGYNLVEKVYDASFDFKNRDFEAFLSLIKSKSQKLLEKIIITANREEVNLC